MYSVSHFVKSCRLTWSAATPVATPDPDHPLGWAPTSGTGIQLRGHNKSGAEGRLLFSLDTIASGLDEVNMFHAHKLVFFQALRQVKSMVLQLCV